MSTSQRLSVTDRGIIVGRLQAGETADHLAEEFGVSPRTIYRIKRQYDETGSVETRPRSGRPEKLSEREKRRIVRAAIKEPRLTLEELAQSNQIQASKNTIRKCLKERSIKSYVAPRKPFLTKKQRRERFLWCLARKG